MATVGELNKKAYVHIEEWRNRPLQGGKYPHVYVNGICLRRNWGGEYENVAVSVAIAVNEDGYREVLSAAEGMKEDKSVQNVVLEERIAFHQLETIPNLVYRICL